MLRVMLRKIWHKKWLILCMLMGILLLTATVASFPMYRTAAYDRMLQDEFTQSMTSTGKWPAGNQITLSSKKGTGGKFIIWMEDFLKKFYDELGVEEKGTVYYYQLVKSSAETEMKRNDVGNLTFRICYLSDFTDHMQLLSGENFSESGITEDGCYEVMISEACMVENNLLLGEKLEFGSLLDAQKNPIRVQIVGVYQKADDRDFYWQVDPDNMDDIFLIKDETFRTSFMGENIDRYTMSCSYYTMIDYTKMKSAQVNHVIKTTNDILEETDYGKVIRKTDYLSVLDEFCKKRDRITVTLTILQIPVLILLCAFLFMISGQMYEMEKNEISVLKSRGSSGGQIFRLYLYQSIFLAVAGAVPGLFLGMLFCKMLGSARNFLEFDSDSVLQVTVTPETFWYLLGAMAVSVLIMTIPAVRHSRVSIVNLKQHRAVSKRNFWEKCFLDFICLGVSLYGYYTFSKNRDIMIQDVLNGKAMDPLLYVSSSLFIVGLGLLLLRLQPLLVKLLFFVGKNHWSSAAYASFLENEKNGRKQQFIMLFMILTISLGIFHATVARTILKNVEENVSYLDGADVIIKEVWTDNSAYLEEDSSGGIQYNEPNFSKYASNDFAQSYTKVIYDANASANAAGSKVDAILMGIHTKEFGENTQMDDSLLEKPYHEYLNELASEEKGIIVSRNFETILGCKIGDTVTYTNVYKKQATGTIVDFVDYWPGYVSQKRLLMNDGSVLVKDNYLIVTHIALIQQSMGNIPYEIWMTLKPEAEENQVSTWISDKGLRVAKYVNRQEDLEKNIKDPLLQGTNGILTMSFIVTILLCGVGYLIYWIMSIRSREMMFGVLRACGMHRGEIFHMLMNEQIFAGVFSVVAGIGIGKAASKLFVPILQTAYTAADQALPMQLISSSTDMGRLYTVLFTVLAACLAVLVVLVSKMNVAKALKLGEE